MVMLLSDGLRLHHRSPQLSLPVFLPFTKQIPEQERRYVLIKLLENLVLERRFPVAVPRGLQPLVVMEPVAQKKPYSIPRRI